MSRVDDVLLLSTGEMFNPVPIEADIDNLAAARGLRLVRVVVLGRDRPSPFLVVEPADDDSLKNPRELLEALEPVVDAVNSKIVEYARIRKGHVLAARLPHSAKGNVQRARAESALATQLDDLAEEAAAKAAEVVDWDALRAAAAKAGYDDVDQYLAEKGTSDLAEMGVDSLGIASLTSRELKESERIGDNVKAWMITCVVMAHWYEPYLLVGGKEGRRLAPSFLRNELRPRCRVEQRRLDRPIHRRCLLLCELVLLAERSDNVYRRALLRHGLQRRHSRRQGPSCLLWPSREESRRSHHLLQARGLAGRRVRLHPRLVAQVLRAAKTHHRQLVPLCPSLVSPLDASLPKNFQTPRLSLPLHVVVVVLLLLLRREPPPSSFGGSAPPRHLPRLPDRSR